MRYTGALLRLVRELGKVFDGTVDASGVVQSGVSNELLLQFLNEAQSHLQASITSAFPAYFYASEVVTIVGGQEAYSVSGALFNNSKIVQVEYSFDGSAAGYRPLKQRSLYERNNDQFQEPLYYILFNNQILLNPIPATSGFSTIRITYYRSLPRMTLRASSVASRTLVSQSLSALTLSTTGDDTTTLALGISEDPFLCFSDVYGTVKAKNITYSAYDTGTGVVTLSPSPQTLPTGDTIAVSDWVTVGKNTCTHSQLPDDCERYLIAYGAKRAANQNSSSDEVAADEHMKIIEADILANFAPVSADIEAVPVLDPYVGEQ